MEPLAAKNPCRKAGFTRPGGWKSENLKPMAGNPTSYDVVAYPGYSHPQTLPDRLAVIATLFGLQPMPVDRCRVLELGCGNGSNLVPMASASPDGEFLGIDLAAQPIAQGQNMIREIGLANVRLQQADLAEFKDTAGKFDYIIAHGLFSWVPARVREHLLVLCRNLLAPQGVAFVSYNAYPGAHLRNMIREMMLFHVRGLHSPPERMQQAQALVKFLAEAQDVHDEYRLWMKAELESILGHEAGHLYHDELGEVNEPFYFTQFAGQAAARGLQYLGEADYFEMFDHGFSEPTRRTLNQLAANRLLREQYLDFLKCRRFRQTLLCHQEVSLSNHPAPEAVTGFFISTRAVPAEAGLNLHPGVKTTFVTPKGARCETDYPLGKAALAVLAANELVPIAFDELARQAAARLRQAEVSQEDPGAETRRLPAFLLELYSAGVVEFRTRLPAITATVSERPAVSPLMQWQARHGNFVTSQLHVAVKVEDEIGRCLLSSLDGTLTHDALADKLWNLVKSNGAFQAQGESEDALRTKVKAGLEDNLQKLARLGLLVA
jgi:methyltransferase-like protein/2-polyprenyl-3-methyl-5-hydroxy-6-metoxy-1,4-benzoquinol methylase